MSIWYVFRVLMDTVCIASWLSNFTETYLVLTEKWRSLPQGSPHFGNLLITLARQGLTSRIT